jgi:SNF2 family DNA or RNA helicase
LLHAQLDPASQIVVFTKSNGVPDDVWSALGRNIDPARNRRYSDERVDASVERFLARRAWLGQLLSTHSCPIEFDAGCQALLARARAEREEVARALADQIPPPDLRDIQATLAASRFQRELRPFQARDLAKVIALSHGANFSVPGAGKTSVALALYEYLRAKGVVDRLLVVAPLSAFDAWFEESGECFEPELTTARLTERRAAKSEVVLVNYQRLAPRFDEVRGWVLAGKTHVILDEAHRMKRGRDGQWGAACLDLAHLAVRRDILTGTPAPQHPRDFEALIDFLWPQQSPIVIPADALANQPTAVAMADLSDRLRPLFARTKKDELGLKKPKSRVELVEMRPVQREIYNALRTRARRALAATPDSAQLARMGAAVAHLLQAASNPALLAKPLAQATASSLQWPSAPIDPASSIGDKILRYGELEMPHKIEKLAEIVRRNAEADLKTLVWSNFVSNLDELHDRMLGPYNPALIYGQVPSGDEDADYRTRERELRRFRTDDSCMVMLANPAAMSEGVSLHKVCHDAVYVDRTFNAGQYLQSIDRIHRLGLAPDKETRITFLVSVGTIDEVVDQRIDDKTSALSQMLSDPNLVAMALPDDDETGDLIEVADVAALFAHLTGPAA